MTRSRLAWGVAVADLAILAVVSLLVDPHPDYIAVAIYAVGVTSFVAVGALLMSRVPTNAIGSLLLAAGTFTVASSALTSLANLGSSQVPRWAWSASAHSVADALFLYPIVIALVMVPLVFPDGQLLSRRFRWVVLSSIVLLVAWAIGAILRTDFVDLIVLLTLLVSFGGAVISVTLRFRRGDPVERQQVKGLAAAVLVAGVFFPIGFLLYNGHPNLSNAVVGVGLLALFALPIVMGIAILRYRLYEIDRIISRTLSYAVVTGILAVVFVGVILLLQALLTPFTGGQTIAVAASTLVVFALFQPVLRRVRHAIDRRFDRARYDAERTSGEFSERLRWQTDIDLVTTDLAHTASTAVVPTSLGIWLRKSGGER